MTRSRELLDEKSSKFPAAFGGQEGTKQGKRAEHHRSHHLPQFSVIFSDFHYQGYNINHPRKGVPYVDLSDPDFRFQNKPEFARNRFFKNIILPPYFLSGLGIQFPL